MNETMLDLHASFLSPFQRVQNKFDDVSVLPNHLTCQLFHFWYFENACYAWWYVLDLKRKLKEWYCLRVRLVTVRACKLRELLKIIISITNDMVVRVSTSHGNLSLKSCTSYKKLVYIWVRSSCNQPLLYLTKIWFFERKTDEIHH